MSGGPRLAETLIDGSGLDAVEIWSLVERAVTEDLRYGPDVTTEATIAVDQCGRAAVVARQPGVIAGLPAAVAALDVVAERLGRHDEVSVQVITTDGTPVRPGEKVLEVSGPLRVLLTAERTLLNLLGQLSGTATLTARWAAAISERTGDDRSCAVRDTRKTVPGLRSLQKYAVRCGGGVNHRLALGDAALIKDNHVAAAGSVRAAFAAVRAHAPRIPIEVEADTLPQVREAVEAGADLILLDNMSCADLSEAVRLAHPAGVRLEASGGLSLANAAEVAATGVDYISVGELTHSAPVLDLGLDLGLDLA